MLINRNQATDKCLFSFPLKAFSWFGLETSITGKICQLCRVARVSLTVYTDFISRSEQGKLGNSDEAKLVLSKSAQQARLNLL